MVVCDPNPQPLHSVAEVRSISSNSRGQSTISTVSTTFLPPFNLGKLLFESRSRSESTFGLHEARILSDSSPPSTVTPTPLSRPLHLRSPVTQLEVPPGLRASKSGAFRGRDSPVEYVEAVEIVRSVILRSSHSIRGPWAYLDAPGDYVGTL